MSTAVLEEKKVIPFEFGNLKKLSKRDLEIERSLLSYLPFVSEEKGVARALENFLKEQFSLPAEISLEKVEEENSLEWKQSLPETCSVALLNMQPLSSKAFLWVDSLLAQNLIQWILGGEKNKITETKSLGPIEEGVFQYLLLKAFSSMLGSFQDFARIHFRLEKVLKNRKEVMEPTQEELPMVILKFRLQVGKVSGFVILALPHPWLETAFLGKGSEWDREKTQEREYTLKKFEQLAHVPTSVWVEVGAVTLTLSEKNQLGKGDVILFDQTLSQWSNDHLTGKVILRVGEGKQGGFLAQPLSTENPALIKLLDYYGG